LSKVYFFVARDTIRLLSNGKLASAKKWSSILLDSVISHGATEGLGNVSGHTMLDTNRHVQMNLRKKGLEADLTGDLFMSKKVWTSVGSIKQVTLEKLRLKHSNMSFIGNDVISIIGHTAIILSLLYKIKVLERSEHNYILTSRNAANANYLSYWEDFFPQLDLRDSAVFNLEDNLWPFFVEICSLELYGESKPFYEVHDIVTRQWEKLNKGPILKLKDKDKELGHEYLAQFGFDSGTDWFVTLHVRNSAALSRGIDLRSSYGRNADISTYVPAIKRIIDLGGWVVRIGESEPDDLPKLDKLIDFTNLKNNHDVLSTYFLAECRFLLGTSSGPLCVPPTFGKPVVMTNAPSIGRSPFYPGSITLPKLVQNLDGTLLTLPEMLGSKSGWSDSWLLNDVKQKLNWRNNSDDEILAAVEEMLSDNLQVQSEIQQKFEKTVREYGSDAVGTISFSFISKWQELLLGD